MSQPISSDDIKRYQTNLNQMPQAQTIKRAVMDNGIKAASERPSAATTLDPVFSDEVETGTVSNQLKSGRCWLFSTLNTMRHDMAKAYHIKDFQLSQNYLSFWDRLEKANLFFANILQSADKPITDREVAFYLAQPDDDGGQWDQAAALIEKYGVVPQSVMPETQASDHTAEFSSVINLLLRKDAKQLRQMVADKASDADIDKTRTQMLSEVYRICVTTFGEPPKTFDFEYRDDDKKYHLDQNLTPQSFYDKYIGWNLDDYIVVASTPQTDKPYDHMYTIPSENTVQGGHPMTILNVEFDKLKQLALTTLQNGETVWFGNDVLEGEDRKKGWLESDLYAESELFSTDLSMNKKDRFDTLQAEMSHAMTLTGVDRVNGKPRRWKVENSWGDTNGEKGYFTMSDSWFNDYVYEVVVRKSILDDKDKAVLNEKPKELVPWDPLH
ncbi:peptidase C1-like family protein [Lactobacillus selangorensis]|uniref:Aminopeptidase n=1 Tax=Lactobacillus selangorensis TaxID=81857 RepID=A0A0R2FVJ0_9LACO|nr:C1 family peptidase [Lactobacillus selangorensis]KRN29180.1 peptidase C1-like family protein [Lactobacillus selangorensis]KRN31462.1 peptidase C1-like family protein [Lactobacillus selangorensis]